MESVEGFDERRLCTKEGLLRTKDGLLVDLKQKLTHDFKPLLFIVVPVFLLEILTQQRYELLSSSLAGYFF